MVEDEGGNRRARIDGVEVGQQVVHQDRAIGLRAHAPGAVKLRGIAAGERHGALETVAAPRSDVLIVLATGSRAYDQVERSRALPGVLVLGEEAPLVQQGAGIGIEVVVLQRDRDPVVGFIDTRKLDDGGIRHRSREHHARQHCNLIRPPLAHHTHLQLPAPRPSRARSPPCWNTKQTPDQIRKRLVCLCVFVNILTPRGGYVKNSDAERRISTVAVSDIFTPGPPEDRPDLPPALAAQQGVCGAQPRQSRLELGADRARAVGVEAGHEQVLIPVLLLVHVPVDLA